MNCVCVRCPVATQPRFLAEDGPPMFSLFIVLELLYQAKVARNTTYSFPDTITGYVSGPSCQTPSPHDRCSSRLVHVGGCPCGVSPVVPVSRALSLTHTLSVCVSASPGHRSVHAAQQPARRLPPSRRVDLHVRRCV